jgi:DNA repair protein RecO (recombination protein O)
MVENTRGLVLRTRPLTETSLIVNWLTPASGRISTVAKGAFRPKSPFKGKLDLFYLADISFSRSRRSELHTLREVILLETNVRLRQDLDALRQASYCASLVEQTTETETPLPSIFELMLGFLSSFRGEINASASGVESPLRVFAFELRLLRELGLDPDLQETRVSRPTQDLANVLQNFQWGELAALSPSTEQTVELRRYLHGFLIYNFGRLARGRESAIAGT